MPFVRWMPLEFACNPAWLAGYLASYDSCGEYNLFRAAGKISDDNLTVGDKINRSKRHILIYCCHVDDLQYFFEVKFNHISVH